MPSVTEWQPFFDELLAAGRVKATERAGQTFWIATERTPLIDDVEAIIAGWMESLGPVTVRNWRAGSL